MEGQISIQSKKFIARTERGELWLLAGQPDSARILRIVEPRFCDLDFRQSVRNLRERRYPRTLPIVDEGWIEDRYYIEYVADSPYEPLEAHFRRLHWRLRLSVIRQICEVLPQWNNCPTRPLGLNGQNIIMMKTAGRWLPWLLAAPPLKFASPCDLFGCDPGVLAALAPEIIRGVAFDERAQDSYALGHLALRALGCHQLSPSLTDEERIEAQARASSVNSEIKASDTEEFLRKEDALKQLMQAALHYTQPKPVARPMGADSLKEACVKAFDSTDPLRLATDMARRGQEQEALRRLEWGFHHFGENVDGHLMAANICEKIEDFPKAIDHLDRAILLLTVRLTGANNFEADASATLDQLYQHRFDLRWILYENLPPLAPGSADPEGDFLLRDLEMFKELAANSLEKNRPYLQAAEIYRRRQDLVMAANELFQAAELEPADFTALFLYGECLKDLGRQEDVVQVVQEAHRRLERMVTNEIMKEREAVGWRQRFDMLLDS
ncbi:MAG: hypothetical protein L0229_10905 [Blastocatellia bacterium]|nr:hypothetical protein [Blastocatellia bacterium]